MKVNLITRQLKETTVELPFVPRIGDFITVTDMDEIYTDGHGTSPLWNVTGVEWVVNNTGFEEVNVFIRNEEDRHNDIN